MTRPLRILEPDGIYNAGSRGNNKETMFRDAIDWMEFLRLLARVSVRHRWEGWAYCLIRLYTGLRKHQGSPMLRGIGRSG
jgi:hypothetical protein